MDGHLVKPLRFEQLDRLLRTHVRAHSYAAPPSTAADTAANYCYCAVIDRSSFVAMITRLKQIIVIILLLLYYIRATKHSTSAHCCFASSVLSEEGID